MKTPETTDNDALENEVMSAAASDFMKSAGASAPVLDVDPTPPSKPVKKPPPKSKKNLWIALAGVIAIGAVAVGFMGSGDEPIDSSLLAEIDAASKQPRAPDPVEPPAPEGESLSESLAAEAETVAPEALPTPDLGDAPPSSPGLPPDLTATLAAPSAPSPETSAVPETAPAIAPPPPAAPPAAPPVAAADSAEVENLRLKVRSLERAAMTPTTIEVAEVLQDGVVLKDGQGRTVVVPTGGQVKAQAGRVEGR